jgi:hypothetical protein
MPDTSEVPSQFRALVDAALMDTMENVLADFVTLPATAGNMNMPATLLHLDKLLATATNSRMTSALLLGMWRNSSKYVLDVAPKLTSYTGSALLRYQAAIEKHEKRIAALTGRYPETALNMQDLDKLMTNLHDDDAATRFGEYLADRTEQVRAKIEEDSDAL